MSEIEKLYENAEIEKEWLYTVKQFNNYYLAKKEEIIQQSFLFNERKTAKITKARKLYPEFTAEKQLSLIKWLANNKCIEISKQFIDLKNNRNHCVSRHELQFEESLAELVNLIWQSLLDTEKAEIKRILE